MEQSLLKHEELFDFDFDKKLGCMDPREQINITRISPTYSIYISLLALIANYSLTYYIKLYTLT